ncbi:MAG: TRAP transporter substrate-binding protein [Deferrisomatales bacterium]|nr:TRAP transporter substrate-binding protein [Deferrisomatales bacterium]
MRRLSGLLSPMLVALFATGAAATTKINLGVVTKPGSAQNIVAEKFKELVEARSKGEFEVKIHHSASLGNETEILQQIQMGTIQMGIITSGPFDTFDPVARVIDYPFLFKDNEQADQILDGPLGQEILTSLESSGFKGLAFSENGFRNLTNSKRAVKTPEDAKGLKIRVMESALHKGIWQSLGANPTPMPWPIYSELEQGVIDGQENPLWVAEVYKMYEVQKYLSMTRHVYSAHIDVASLQWWNSLKPEEQTLLQASMLEAAKFQRAENRKADAGRIALVKDKGMQVEEHPDVAAFRAKVAGMKDMELFKDSKVQGLLQRMMAATR